MKPVNIENLENLLNRIWSGELLHHQGFVNREFTCGTIVRCLAGWDFYLNCPDIGNHAALEWSRDNNCLTETEAGLMFHSVTTKEMHFLALEAFKSGRRLDDRLFWSVRNSFGYITKQLKEDFVEIADSEALYNFQYLEELGDFFPVEVREFLGIKEFKCQATEFNLQTTIDAARKQRQGEQQPVSIAVRV